MVSFVYYKYILVFFIFIFYLKREWTFEYDIACSDLIEEAEQGVIPRAYRRRGQRFLKREQMTIPIERLVIRKSDNMVVSIF